MWWAGSPCFHPVNPSHPQTTNYTTSVALYRVCHTFPRIPPDRQIAVPSGVGRPHRAAVEQQAPYPPPRPGQVPEPWRFVIGLQGPPGVATSPAGGLMDVPHPLGGVVAAPITQPPPENLSFQRSHAVACMHAVAAAGGCWALLATGRKSRAR